MNARRILVPSDFTGVADCAVGHALRTAEIIGGSVVIMHVVPKPILRDKAATNLEFQAKEAIKRFPTVAVSYSVREGSIFEEIPQAAIDEKADLIIMGTHGLKGMQHLTGSYALKVVTNSKVPFVIVQERPIKPRGYRNIIVPLDLSKETKQKLKMAAGMAGYFNSKIHLFSPFESDQYLQNQLQRNLSYAKKFFVENGINHDTTIGKTRSHGFAKDLIRFAHEQDADLITILNAGEGNLSGILGGKEEANVIKNEWQIPVMLINPKDAGHFWFG